MTVIEEGGDALRRWELHVRRCQLCTAARDLRDLCPVGRPLFDDASEERMTVEELLDRRA